MTDRFPICGWDSRPLAFPGFDGGAEWGGQAADPERGILYLNSNDVAWTGGLVENRKAASLGEAALSGSLRRLAMAPTATDRRRPFRH